MEGLAGLVVKCATLQMLKVENKKLVRALELNINLEMLMSRDFCRFIALIFQVVYIFNIYLLFVPKLHNYSSI